MRKFLSSFSYGKNHFFSLLMIPAFCLEMFFVVDLLAEGSAGKTQSLRVLEEKMVQHLLRVEEFREVRSIAERLNLRVWLFGGGAASYAFYVSRDIKREAGDTRFPKEKFDYRFDNIFWPHQDVDLVVDGKLEKIKKFREALQEKYDYSLSYRKTWDIRPLKEAEESREALLGNADFLNAHNDSLSTAFIEITDPPKGEGRIRDHTIEGRQAAGTRIRERRAAERVLPHNRKILDAVKDQVHPGNRFCCQVFLLPFKFQQTWVATMLTHMMNGFQEHTASSAGGVINGFPRLRVQDINHQTYN